MKNESFLIDGPAQADWTLVLAHGAGAGMDTPFMTHIAEGLGRAGIRVVRFEFPYMQKRREDGKKRPPNKTPALLEHFQAVLGDIRPTSKHLAIGGKSMGGRMASLLPPECGHSATVALGYPFHPPGKPDNLRTQHLHHRKEPMLIIQGERDPFGNLLEIPNFNLSAQIQVVYMQDGDHSLKPRVRSGYTHQQHLDRAVDAINSFITALECP